MSINSIGKSTNMCEKCVNRKQFKTLTILLPENNFHFIQSFLYLHMYVFYTILPIDFLTDIIIISRYGHFHSFCHNIIWCFITQLMIFSVFESMFLLSSSGPGHPQVNSESLKSQGLFKISKRPGPWACSYNSNVTTHHHHLFWVEKHWNLFIYELTSHLTPPPYQTIPTKPNQTKPY